MHPLSKACGVVPDAKQHGTSTVDQHASQIDVAALADAQQFLFAAGGVLPGNDAQPGGKVAPAPKGSSVADGGYGGAGDQRTEAGNLVQPPAERILFADALDFLRDRLDVVVNLFPLQPQALQQPAQTRTQVLLGIFHHLRQLLAELSRPHREGHAAFQQESTDLIDQGGATLHQSIADAMHRLYVELFFALDRHKAHVLFAHRFGDRLSIDKVVLIRLTVGLYKLAGNQAYIVPLLSQSGSQEVRSRTCFQANQRGSKVRRIGQQLHTRQLLTKQNLVALSQRNQVKGVLA